MKINHCLPSSITVTIPSQYLHLLHSAELFSNLTVDYSCRGTRVR